MSDINAGVLIIGLSNTVLFGADQTVELILLNLATGEDFTLPVSPEQADHVLAHLNMAEESVAPQAPESEEAVEVADGKERLQGILPEIARDAWDKSEKASQL
jgi:hypothetical protein